MSIFNNFIKSYGAKDRFWLALIVVFAAAAVAPIAFFGVPDGSDLIQHLRFAATFHDAIRGGDFFPGLAADNNFGFGSISIRYYPPLAYYLMALTQLVTKSWYDTFWLNAFFWMATGCAGVYYWAKEWLAPRHAFCAAALYAVVPYHLSQIYQYLLFGEFAASAMLPFCFFFATRLVKRGRAADVLLFAAAYALLILTHIPLTIIGSTGLAVYVFLLIDWKKPLRAIFNFAASFAITLAATAFHWLRLVSEIGWVNHNSPQYYASGYYDYSKYFFPMFLTSGSTYQTKMLWLYDVTIVFSICLFLPLVVYILWQLKSKTEGAGGDRKIYYTLVVTGFFSIFILSLPSSFVWKSVSVLQKTQFPWRWLALTSAVGVVAFTIGLRLLAARFSKWKKPFGYAALMFILAIFALDASQIVLPAAFLSRDDFELKLAQLNDEAECACWWTIWAKEEAFENREKVSAGERAATVARWDAERREFTLERGEATRARLATFYHPFWKAEVDGAVVEPLKADDGTLLVPVSTSATTVKLSFEEPLKLKVALAVSLVSWILLITAAAVIFYRKRERFAEPFSRID